MAEKKSSHFLFGEMDMFDQLLIILVGLVALFINLGLIDYQWIAYWPILLIAIGLKEILQSN
jgi:uncharacterized membrane protein